ncbi:MULTISPECIES: hypothetical protein [Shewanella]|uniref:Uncharacterized protein n=2 Tax=Shewanella TaxID=22 RepID=A0A3G8LTL5_9GAMM|nr:MULTISPECIES: hypothetical protein [Shewanella]AZG72565.1 hypothetical protein EGC82_07115 [Shewanella livingstonensis]
MSFQTTEYYLFVMNAYVLCYVIYHVDIALTAGDNEFKIATADWSTIDFGAIVGDDAVTEGLLKTLVKKAPTCILMSQSPVPIALR